MATDSMLVLLAQQGDREALNRLLASVQVRLFRYICGILADHAAAAEDVRQETRLPSVSSRWERTSTAPFSACCRRWMV